MIPVAIEYANGIKMNCYETAEPVSAMSESKSNLCNILNHKKTYKYEVQELLQMKE